MRRLQYYKKPEITQKVISKILEAPPSIGPPQANLSRQFSTHGHSHAAKDMFQACPDSRLDTIQLLGIIPMRMIPSSLFVDQAFEACETKEIQKHLPVYAESAHT
jgi:hypothetical protein